MLRLSQVRGALLSARGQLVTVTEIATDFGFAELGRFSVEYRKVFGESPSETLHQARVSNGMNAPGGGYPISYRWLRSRPDGSTDLKAAQPRHIEG
jgi:AraC-like DNA-binding protein